MIKRYRFIYYWLKDQGLLMPNINLVDCACGFGRGTQFFAQRECNCIGVDIDPERVEKAIKRHKVDARLGDLRNLDIPDD